MRPISGLSDFRKIKSLLGVTGGATAIFVGLSLYQGNEKFYNQIAMPVMRLIDPEISHRISVNVAKFGLAPKQKTSYQLVLQTNIW